MDGGLAFKVTVSGDARDSIARMVTAHAETTNGVGGFSHETAEIGDGAAMIVRADDTGVLEKLKSIGFIGRMTLVAHHQSHHIAIARGTGPRW